MRDHAKIRPQFWIRGTGKALRGDREAREMAFYLMSAPTSNMLGLYYLPLNLLTHELGYTSDAETQVVLQRLIDKGFCKYDPESEYLWVINGAREQIDEALKPTDNRIKGIRTELKKHRKCPFHDEFVEHYNESFSLEISLPNGGKMLSPYQGPPKPLPRASEGVENENGTPSKPGAGSGAGSGAGVTRARTHASPPGDEPETGPPELREQPPGKPEPLRFRATLEGAIGAEFFAQSVTSQKAAAAQWLDGCKTVQEALDLGLFSDPQAAIQAFAKLVVAEVERGEKLGFALQQVQLGAPLQPAFGGRQLSELALRTIRESNGDGR